MSTTCLVEKLKSPVDNESLERLNEVIIEFTSTSETGTDCYIDALNFSKARIIGEGYILDENGANPVASKDVPQDGKLYFSAGNYKLGLSNKNSGSNLHLRHGGANYPINTKLNLDELGSGSYQYIGYFTNTNNSEEIKGSVNSINPSQLVEFYFTVTAGTLITGELSSLASPTLRCIHCAAPLATTNIDAFATAIKLTELTVNRTTCRGEVNTMVRGMISNTRTSGTLVYTPGSSSTYDGNELTEFYDVVTIKFLSSTSYTVTVNGVTDTWTLSNGVWIKS